MFDLVHNVVIKAELVSLFRFFQHPRSAGNHKNNLYDTFFNSANNENNVMSFSYLYNHEDF